MRDPDHCAYYKEDAGKLLIGAFEPKAKPWGMNGIPEDFWFDELAEDFEHFQPILEGAMHRVPKLSESASASSSTARRASRPTSAICWARRRSCTSLFVAAGFNSIGIQSAGGAGMALAEWIVGGHPPFDLWDVDIRRMQPHQDNKPYLADRVSEALGLLYAMHWPYRQYETARGIRLTPLYVRLKEHGACFGEVAGWERANWFAPEGSGAQIRIQLRAAELVRPCGRRVKAAREAVGPLRPVDLRQIPGRGPRRRARAAAHLAPTMSRSSRAAPSIPSGSTSAAGSRRTDRDAALRGRATWW